MSFKKNNPGCPCCDCGTICVQVVGCGHNVQGATVTITPGSHLTCTTPESGQCCIGVPLGTYTVTVDAPGYESATTEVIVSSCSEYYTVVSLDKVTPEQFCVLVLGCSYGMTPTSDPIGVGVAGYKPLAGATVNLKRGGITIFTVTSGADGRACFSVSDLDPYDLEITHPDYTYTTGLNCIPELVGYYTNPATVAADLCEPLEYPACMRPDADHVCCGGWLIPKAMMLSNSKGTIAFNYSPADGYWIGCQSFTAKITACDINDHPFEADATINVTWYGACTRDESGAIDGFTITELWGAQCDILAPYGGVGAPTYFWTFVIADCPITSAGIINTRVLCNPPAGETFTYTGGGILASSLVVFPISSFTQPFAASVSMPTTGITYAAGVACPDPFGSGAISPPIPLPVTGSVTCS